MPLLLGKQKDVVTPLAGGMWCGSTNSTSTNITADRTLLVQPGMTDLGCLLVWLPAQCCLPVGVWRVFTLPIEFHKIQQCVSNPQVMVGRARARPEIAARPVQ